MDLNAILFLGTVIMMFVFGAGYVLGHRDRIEEDKVEPPQPPTLVRRR